MLIQSKYTKIFKSNNMTRLKYNELYDFAVLIRNHKNTVSEYVNKNLLHFLEYSKFTFVKEMREHFKGCISSSFDAQLYTQIFDCYQNKFSTIQKQLRFEHITFLSCELYKRTTKKHNIGDFKKLITEKKQTLLSNCLTYLARYGNENTIEYITKQLVIYDEKKRRFYNNILRCVDKFGFDRLMCIAAQKRNRVISRYADKPIEFKSLSFSGRCRKDKIIDYNSKFGSVINAYISLYGLRRKSFDIPIKFSKDWYGDIKNYYKKKPDYEYTLTFNEKEHQVNIHLCTDGEIYIYHKKTNHML